VTVLDVEGIAKSYDGAEVLRDVTFAVERGETVGVFGASGTGKTTLLRLIAGLDRPDRGTIRIDGEVANDPRIVLPPRERGIGFVFQCAALWPHMTVAQNVLFAMGRLEKEEARERLTELLEAMNIAGLGQRRPHEISEGQAQRVALARALAANPRLLLMDEPLSHLDDDAKRRMMDLIRSEAVRSGATVLYVSHDRAEIDALASRVLCLVDGRLETRGQ
jgi:iron(III) transport system ATP-binding protein